MDSWPLGMQGEEKRLWRVIVDQRHIFVALSPLTSALSSKQLRQTHTSERLKTYRCFIRPVMYLIVLECQCALMASPNPPAAPSHAAARIAAPPPAFHDGSSNFGTRAPSVNVRSAHRIVLMRDIQGSTAVVHAGRSPGRRGGAAGPSSRILSSVHLECPILEE